MPKNEFYGIPLHCLIGSATGIGTVLIFSKFHTTLTSLPVTCVAGTLAAAGTVGSVIVHHQFSAKVPPIPCWLGSAAGLAGLYYFLAVHKKSKEAKDPAKVCDFIS
mmetsp:Transcript_31944/g.85304  ORF Transcript_31944/g.85304 Transcript_31944/m.85304 type:complete len:106 (-) Transcript_31944:179-496(-)